MTIIYLLTSIAVSVVIAVYTIKECKERKRAKRIIDRVNEIIARERTGRHV